MASNVIFESFTGRNFLRFGNQDFRFDFRKGITGLFGNNGLGKSAIVDGICICLFNETYRDSNKEDWVNNVNKKGLFLNTTIRIENGSEVDTYNIIQDHSSKKTSEQRRIIKNGEILTDIQNIQEHIEQKILGFNLNLFKNSIAVCADIPFISMTLEQKRQFSDNLFSIKQVSIFKKKASEALSELKISNTISNRDLQNIETKIVEYNKVIEASKIDNSAKLNELKIELVKYKELLEGLSIQNDEKSFKLQEINIEINKINLEITEQENIIKKLDQNKKQANIKKLESELAVCKNDYVRVSADIKKIIPNVPCYACGNSFTEETAKEHIETHNKQLLEHKSKGIEIKGKLDIANKEMEEILKINGKIQELKNNKQPFEIQSTRISSDLSNIQYNIKLNVNNISAKEKSIKQIENGEDTSTAIQLAEKSIKECGDSKIEIVKNIEEVENKIKAYEYIIKMCSDDGIKSMLLKKFIPFLNKLINYYLSIFALPVTIIFDDHFKHTLQTHPGIGHKHSLLSKGQKKRIDIAILFAIVDLIKLMGNFKCNLLFLDEFADGNVDAQGFSDTINMIRKISDRDDKAIVVVSHKTDDVLYDNLDYMYTLETNELFSILKEVAL